MDVVRLPLIKSSETLERGWRAMKEAGRAAVIVRDADDFWIAKANRILVARQNKFQRIDDIGPQSRHVGHQLSAADLQRFRVDTARPVITEEVRRDLRRYFDRLPPDRHYLLALTSDAFANLIARTSDFALELSIPATCYCTGPRQHPYEPPPKPANNICPLDRSRIVCSRD
jgi:hypothetical protein